MNKIILEINSSCLYWIYLVYSLVQCLDKMLENTNNVDLNMPVKIFVVKMAETGGAD